MPSTAHAITVIARDDDQVSILENCKDHSAENVTAPCPDAAMCGTQIEKKKDVRVGEDDGIEEEVGPTLFFERVDVRLCHIRRDSLDTAF